MLTFCGLETEAESHIFVKGPSNQAITGTDQLSLNLMVILHKDSVHKTMINEKNVEVTEVSEQSVHNN